MPPELPPRICFVPTAEQMKRYKILRKALVDNPKLVNLSEEFRDKLDEVMDRLKVPKQPFLRKALAETDNLEK